MSVSKLDRGLSRPVRAGHGRGGTAGGAAFFMKFVFIKRLGPSDKNVQATIRRMDIRFARVRKFCSANEISADILPDGGKVTRPTGLAFSGPLRTGTPRQESEDTL
jgi:hypothetical protein